MPGRNIADYAEAAIESLLAQTYPHWRALLIDDASEDGTERIFADAAARDSRFAVRRLRTQVGLGAARNIGIAAADTEFLAFLDGDDEYTPAALERLRESLISSGSDVVVGAYVRLHPENGGYLAGEVQPWVRASTSPARRAVTLDEHPGVTGNIVAWSKMSRTSLWRAHDLRFPEGVLYEDQQLTQRMYVAAKSIDTIEDVVVRWRVRAEGTSITQREAEPAVFSACVAALRAGVAELTGHPEALGSRIALIRSMDLPRLRRAADSNAPSHALLDALDAELESRLPR